MTPGGERLILEKLGELTTELVETRRDVQEIKLDGKETKAQVKLTNGRVTALERDKIVQEALRSERADRLQELAKDKAEVLAESTKRHDERMTFWRGAALVLFGTGAGQVIPAVVHALTS